MKVYKTEDIRNIALLGHGSSGKTTLAEGMALLGGLTTRMGSIASGNTISDFDKEEQKRGFSMSTAVIPLEWENKKINILDTPGYFDFVGEAEEAVSAADGAIIVVNGKAGVQTGTIKAWDLCEKNQLPRMIFITGMDQADADFEKVISDLIGQFGSSLAPVVRPIVENEKFVGYVNVVKGQGRRFTEAGKRVECEIPADCQAGYEESHGELMEAVAETSEELMERYFDGEEFSNEEVVDALKNSVSSCDLVPVYCGSGITAHGVRNMLSDIISYMPSPAALSCSGKLKTDDSEFAADYDPAKAKSCFVFKTMVDPFIGKYSFIKVKSGVLKTDDTLYNNRADEDERIGKLYVLQGNKPIEVPELYAGDIGALAKLNDARTGDTYSEKGTPVVYPLPDYSKPYTYMRYIVPNKGEDDKAASALSRMVAEDVTLKVVPDSANSQQLIYGIGDQQLDVLVSKLQSRYKVEIKLEAPRIAFKETILRNSDVDSKYKKQTGGHGQYGHVKMRFEPSNDQSTAYVFEEMVVGGTVPKNYFPAVEKGLQESVVRGPLAGYPVVGVKATLYDGSYHPVVRAGVQDRDLHGVQGWFPEGRSGAP